MRRVHFAGCKPSPDAAWMKQIAKDLTDCVHGFLNGKRPANTFFTITAKETTNH